MLQNFPGAHVTENRVDQHPIQVTIEAETDGDVQTIWSGDQKDLFSKYGHRALPAINKALGELKAKI